MSNINLDILNKLKDEDIKIICKNADLEMMLQPIKHNEKHYAEYRSQLGRLDKKSVLVQKNLPRIVCELYHKGDRNYEKFFAMEATHLKKVFKEILKDFMGEAAEPEQVSTYTIADYRKIFRGILDNSGSNLNLELFFLQSRLFGIEISDDMKKQIVNEWQHLQEIESLKKEMQLQYAQEHRQKEEEARAKFELQKEEHNKKIISLENEIKALKSDVASKQQEISDGERTRAELVEQHRVRENISKELYNKKVILLENEIKRLKAEVISKQQTIVTILNDGKKASKEIEALKEQIVIMQLDIEDMNARLQERRNEVYATLQAAWQEENQEKMSQIKELDGKKVQLLEGIIELEAKQKQLEKTLSGWEAHLESYFLNIDQKIIEHRIDSILYHKGYNNPGFLQTAATLEHSANVNHLYVKQGSKVDVKEVCGDYEDYLDIVETNLSNIGDKMPEHMMNDCFNSAINAGLAPLICGYRARELATALIASRYAEKPEIICVPAGYGNTNELVAAIDMAETITVIVEDVFGRMNEAIILPILRDSQSKVKVFTAESVEDIAHLPRYYFNYLQLIVSDKYTNVKAKNYVYADADQILSGNGYTGKEKGHKLARQIFETIGMESPYVLTRGNVLCGLLDNIKNNTEEEALIKLLTTEVKWLLKECEKEKLIKSLESSEIKYSKNLIECIG